MANKYLKTILFLAFVVVSEIAIAGPPPPPPPVVPIDGGILGLIVLAVGFAIKKIHDHSKK